MQSRFINKRKVNPEIKDSYYKYEELAYLNWSLGIVEVHLFSKDAIAS